MDRSLDAIINERKRDNSRGDNSRRDNSRGGDSSRGNRGRRQANHPRDGVRKNQRDEVRDLDRDWVHDRFNEHDDDNYDSRRPARNYRSDRRDRYADSQETAPSGAKIRVENIHYDLTEEDLRGLFSTIGRINSFQMLYDKHDRSRGIGFVTYAREADARAAIKEFDGANANGQPISLTLVPSRNPFDSAVRPGRSLFDRIETRNRSASPDSGIRHSDVSKPPPSHIDRYVPGEQGNQQRRGPGRRDNRGQGRRPGARREDSSRREEGGGGGGNRRPRKTADELDAEMADYFKGDNANQPAADANQNGSVAPATAAPVAAVQDDDIDMIE